MEKSTLKSPIVLVGLPRSGSTLLSRILNESLDLFIVNDLYYLQEVQSIDAFRCSNKKKTGHLAAFLVSKLKSRSATNGKRGFVKSLVLTEQNFNNIERYSFKLVQEGCQWDQLMQYILCYAAKLEEKTV